MLRPMEESYDGADRKCIGFETDDLCGEPTGGSVGNTYCSRWFRSVKARAVWYARVAERCRCEAYCLDAGGDRMGGYAFNAYWKGIVAEVRKVYTGALTSGYARDADGEGECRPRRDFWLHDLDFRLDGDGTVEAPGRKKED